jgi:hypothetical protein
MKHRRNWRQAAGVAVVIGLVLRAASPAWAACTVCKTTSLLLPLSGEFFHPPNPCVTAGETVSSTGNVHVVAHVTAVVRANFLTDVYTNLAGVTGRGETTGTTYIGTGAAKFLDVLTPPQPVFPPSRFEASSRLNLPTGAAVCRCR